MDPWLHSDLARGHPPMEVFQQKMKFQETATVTIARASNDEKLVAHCSGNIMEMFNNYNLDSGVITTAVCPLLCQAAYGPKITWRGTAVVVIWLVHGTSLIRASYEHTRPIISSDGMPSNSQDDFSQQALQAVRGRGVTQFLDLPKSNKKKMEDIQSDEEDENLDGVSEPEEHQGLPPEPHGVPMSFSTTWPLYSDRKSYPRVCGPPF